MQLENSGTNHGNSRAPAYAPFSATHHTAGTPNRQHYSKKSWAQNSADFASLISPISHSVAAALTPAACNAPFLNPEVSWACRGSISRLDPSH